MEGSRKRLLIASVVALAVAGCGGGERQDENEPSGSFPVDVQASFAKTQALAAQEDFKVVVRNTGDKAVPNVAVTVDSFADRSKQQGLADPERPIWIVDEGPKGGITSYTNTWALGELAAGASKTFVWKVTPVRSGTHTVKYRVAAGLDGKAKAVSPSGSSPEGQFVVDVSDQPAEASVDPETGDVVREGE
jgi:hypothetical protein